MTSSAVTSELVENMGSLVGGADMDFVSLYTNTQLYAEARVTLFPFDDCYRI